MFNVQKFNGVIWQDVSSHTLSDDATAQQQRFIDSGIDSAALQIVESDNYNPVSTL